MSLVVNLIGQRSQDVIGRLSVSCDVIGCEDSLQGNFVVGVKALLISHRTHAITKEININLAILNYKLLLFTINNQMQRANSYFGSNLLSTINTRFVTVNGFAISCLIV